MSVDEWKWDSMFNHMSPQKQVILFHGKLLLCYNQSEMSFSRGHNQVLYSGQKLHMKGSVQ